MPHAIDPCASFPVAAVALRRTHAAASGLAFVVNSGGASISLVDMSAQKELRRIPVLREPHHVALSPDGKSLLVGDTVGNEMLFLDPATGAIQKRMPVADPYQLGFSPDGKFLVVNGLARNQVDVYDAGSMQLVKRFPVTSMPSHLAYAPDSSRVFVSLQGTDAWWRSTSAGWQFFGTSRWARRRPASCGTTARCWSPTWAPTMSLSSTRRTDA